MADSAAKAKYLRKAAEVLAKLKKNGHQAGFGYEPGPENGYGPTGLYREVGKSYVFPLEWKADFSDDVRVDDLFFMVSNEVDLEDDGITRMDDKYNIADVQPFKPDGETVIYYEIQVRG